MENGIRLADIVVDCGDEQALCGFYEKLLGWERFEMFGHPALRSAGGVVFLFVQDDDYTYTPPVWPERENTQQKQMHFDFLTLDVPAAVERAVSLGAVKAPDQFGGEHFTTMFDPAGHPFCLCKAE